MLYDLELKKIELKSNNESLSKNELKLISDCGYGNLVDHLSAPALYRLCVEKMFIENAHGSHVDALRRACKALANSELYRNTVDFELLIEY